MKLVKQLFSKLQFDIVILGRIISMKQTTNKHSLLRKKIGHVFLVFLLLIGQALSIGANIAVAATSTWTQTDWSSGSGQTNWSDTAKFDSSASVTTSTAGQVTLTNSEKLSNTGFETDLSSWSQTTETGTFPDTSFAADSGAVAAWPLDDTTTTQSYSRVQNPGVGTGRELIINGGFDTDTLWTKGTGVTIAGGVAVFSSVAGGQGVNPITAIPLVLGKAYQITYTISGYSSGTIAAYVGTTSGPTTRNTDGTFTQTLICSGSTAFFITAGSTFTGNIDNVSVKQVNIPASNATPNQLLTDGNMETAGVASWTVLNSTLTKQSATPHSGSQVLRVTYNSAVNPSATQAVLVIGQTYRISGFTRSDGTAVPFAGTTGTLPFGGTSSTTWQPFDFILVATTTSVRLGSNASSAGQYVEFDDVVVSLDTGIRSDEILSTLDGNMETSGTGYWVAGQNATLTKETTSPHGGTQLLRVAYNGTNFPNAGQTMFVVGKTYRVHGYAKSSGAYAPLVSDSVTNRWTGTTSTSWQEFDTTFIASGTPLRLYENANTAGYVEFDDVSVTEVDPLAGLATNGVTLGSTASGHLTNAYTFDGTNDFVNIYSSDLNSSFNPSEGTLVAWAKVANAGVWTDATTRYIAEIGDGSNNRLVIQKTTTSNQIQIRYFAGGTVKQVADTSLSGSTNWFQVVFTWSKSNDQVKAYINGAQSGSTQTGLGTWAANLVSTTTAIGVTNTSGGTSPWSGMINDVRLYNRVLTVDEISQLYNGYTATRDTTTKYTGTASMRIVADPSNAVNSVQSVDVGDTNTYNLTAYAYTDGSAVTVSDAQLFYNGSTVSTTYTSVGGGWYQLTGTVTGGASARNYGVQAKAGKTVYIDNVSVNNYASSGTITSSIFDTGVSSEWGVVSLSKTLPTGTAVSVKARTSNSSTMSAAPTFASCTALTSGVDMSSNLCVVDGHRYIQYQLTLETTRTDVTPTVSDVSFETISTLNVSLDSPGDNSNVSSDRPTFSWKSNGDSSISKYQFVVSSQTGQVFSLDNIPSVRTSDYVTNKFVVHYENFSDSDTTNNYISLYTKDSSDWAQSDNFGRLAEGKNVWTVKAVDSAGNAQGFSRNVYFDSKSPTVTLSSLGAVPFDAAQNNWYYTTLKPSLVGVSSEPGTVQIRFDRKGFNSTSLSTFGNFLTTSLSTDANGRFSWTPDKLSYGEYIVSIQSKDNAGNISPDLSFHLLLTTEVGEPAKPVATVKPTPVAGPVPSITPSVSVTPKPTPVSQKSVGGPVSTGPNFFQVIATTIASALSGIFKATGSAVSFVAEKFVVSVTALVRVGTGAVALSVQITTWSVQSVANGVNFLADRTTGIANSVLAGIGSGINGAATMLAQVTTNLGNAVASIQSASNNLAVAVGDKVTDISDTIGYKIVNVGYLFVTETLVISDVKVEELSATSAKVTWKTNNPATTKVNYGLTADFGQDNQSQDRVTDHEVILTNLTPDTQYFYEVMSQEKNYVFDANHTFTTPRE